MSFSEKLAIAIKVIQDWRAIFILILVMLYVALGRYVVNYQKKSNIQKAPKKAAVKEEPKAEAAPAADAAKDENKDGEKQEEKK